MPLRNYSLFAACALLLLDVRIGAADLVRLKNGAELRGEIQRSQDDARNGTITIRTLTGAVVRVNRQDVQITARRSMRVEEYETRARQIPDTIDAHWSLAEWCVEHSLKDQRLVHLERIIELDPEHAAAREGLDHKLVDGRWMTHEEYMASQGYVKFKGRYITAQELNLIEKTAEELEEEREWFRQIRLWKGWMTGRNPQKAAEALSELQQVTAPAAVPGLSRNFADEDDVRFRRLMVTILAGIDGAAPVPALVKQSLHDVDRELRYEALNALKSEQYSTAQDLYLAALRHDSNEVVNRAGQAIQRVGDESAVPALIEFLITRHEYRVQVPDRSGTTSFGTDASYGVQPGQLPAELVGGIANGQFPNGVIIRQPDEPIRWRTVLVVRQHQNADVLSALQKLTSKDFGYDKRTWRLWWTAYKNGLDQQ